MAGPLFLSENILNTLLFTGHTLTASEEAAGFEVWRIADGRRSEFDYWTGLTANTQQLITLNCGTQVRAANCLFLDRGHNLAGFSFALDVGFDNVNWQTVVSITLPTVSITNLLTDRSAGVRTEEGAWGMLFSSGVTPPYTGNYWRLRIPAMGSGLYPKIVGAYLGMAYQPVNPFLDPWDDDQRSLTAQRIITPYAWQGVGPRGRVRQGSIRFNLNTDGEYDLARLHLGGYYGDGYPTWLVHDIAQADRACLIAVPDGPLSIGFQPNWFPRQTSFNYLEHEPLPV